MQTYLEPTQEAGRAFFMRGITGRVVMLNLLRYRGVADYSATPQLAPAQPISGEAAYRLYMEHTMPYLEQSGGCFAKAVHAGTATGDHFRTTVYALALGLGDEAQSARSLAYIEGRMTAAPAGGPPLLGPNDAHFMLLACARHARPDLAERWIHRAFASNLRAEAWTLWEHVSPNTSLCHAWSAAPVWWLSEEVLGARWDPAQPESVEIAPDCAGLTWAEGAVPHPHGPIMIRWELRGEELRLTIEAPAGVQAVCRPRGRLAGYRLKVMPAH